MQSLKIVWGSWQCLQGAEWEVSPMRVLSAVSPIASSLVLATVNASPSSQQIEFAVHSGANHRRTRGGGEHERNHHTSVGFLRNSRRGPSGFSRIPWSAGAAGTDVSGVL